MSSIHEPFPPIFLSLLAPILFFIVLYSFQSMEKFEQKCVEKGRHEVRLEAVRVGVGKFVILKEDQATFT